MSLALLEELAERHLLQDVTDREGLASAFAGGIVAHYAGFDPTSHSLHVGNLVPVMLQARLQQAGHKPIVVAGGATGMVGDPSGKSAERNILDPETLAQNTAAIKSQLSQLLEFGSGPRDAVLVDNYDWLGGLGYLEFLRDVGKYLTINYMIAKDSVRSRLEDREQGISYTEFSYMLLQAYDFVKLAETHGCRLQVGGSDQWGNITAGIELQRKLGRPTLFGLTAPLLLDSAGQKMGKTSTGLRIWLDPTLTSPYAFHQYWLNVSDDDAPRFLRIFSRRELAELRELTDAHAATPDKRIAQRALADDITTWIHSPEATRRANRAGQVLFGGALDDLDEADLDALAGDVPTTEIPRATLDAGINIVDLLVQCGLCKSKGDARRLVSQGGAYINNVRVTGAEHAVTVADLATATQLLLRAGKTAYHLIRSR